MSKSYLLLLIMLLGSLTYTGAPHYQSDNKFVRVTEGALDDVPTHLRKRLIQRLDTYLRSVSAGKFDNIYDLMPDDCKGGLSKDEWLSQSRWEGPGRPQEFLIENVYIGDYDGPRIWSGERWIVRGCQKYQKGQEAFTYKASFSLLLLSAEWYVCRSGRQVEGTDNQSVPCSDLSESNLSGHPRSF